MEETTDAKETLDEMTATDATTTVETNATPDVTATANPGGTEIVIETVANATKTGTSAGIATSLLHAAPAQALTVTPGVTLPLPLRHLPRLRMVDHKYQVEVMLIPMTEKKGRKTRRWTKSLTTRKPLCVR